MKVTVFIYLCGERIIIPLNKQTTKKYKKEMKDKDKLK